MSDGIRGNRIYTFFTLSATNSKIKTIKEIVLLRGLTNK